MKLLENHYGKSRVRVARIVRHKDRHDFHEMTVDIQLQGDFAASFLEGDNRRIVATDTMKNTVYALAKDPAIAEPESFGLLLARHFLEHNSHVTGARIAIRERLWERHGRYSFTGGPAHRRTAGISVTRTGTVIEAGVAGLLLLKTTGSAFEGYLRDRYTTLKETSDRILATSLDAAWSYRGEGIGWGSYWRRVMKLVTDTFAGHESKSVQHTLYAIGEVVLAQCGDVQRIRLRMPNKHYLLTNLEPFGLDNPNEVFCPTDEPRGVIEAEMSR